MTALDLARRAVACHRWRWMPGMLVQDGERMTNWGYPAFSTIDVGATGVAETVKWGDVPRRSLPDLTDPATLGCLLALVREALGDRRLCTYPVRMSVGNWWNVGVPWDAPGGRFVSTADTEAAALVAALEAAP
jgi:hypothetical protein